MKGGLIYGINNELFKNNCWELVIYSVNFEVLLFYSGKIYEQLKPAVKFLLCLKDTAEPQHPDAVGHSSEYQHDAYTKQVWIKLLHYYCLNLVHV